MALIYESQESSSPIITKAVANGLLGLESDNYHFSNIQKNALNLIGRLPKQCAEWLIPRVNNGNALSTVDVNNLKTNDLTSTRISDYESISEKFPAITIGIGMGGTTAHLAISLGGPFLPQAFVMTLQKGTKTGNVNEYCKLTKDIAKVITDNNPELMSIQHYDPVHDGWLVKRVNHLRLKLIDLPENYKQFMRNMLIPGGDVVYLEGKANWKRYRVGQKNVFQVGGWGDISADEFIKGSGRLAEFAKREKLIFPYWALDGYPIETGPESEWGSEPGLGEALESFCREEGFNFVKISFENPNDFSTLAFFAKLEQIKKRNISPSGVVIEMFSQFDTKYIHHTSLIPLWLIFNTHDSMQFLASMTKYFPKGVPIFFSGLATFSLTPDMVLWEEWMTTLKEFDVVNIGARQSHYPFDALALINWKKPLIEWAKDKPYDQFERISANELVMLANKIKNGLPI